MDAITKPQALDWVALHNAKVFSKPQPLIPVLVAPPAAPSRSDPHFTVTPVSVTMGTLDWIIPGRRRKKIANAQLEENRRTADANERFSRVHAEWERRYKEVSHERQAAQAAYDAALASWRNEKQAFEEEQNKYNLGLDDFHNQYLRKLPEALLRYWDEVLAWSQYPESFPRDCNMSYDPAKAMLILDYELPNQSAIPNKKQVKYVAIRQEFRMYSSPIQN